MFGDRGVYDASGLRKVTFETSSGNALQLPTNDALSALILADNPTAYYPCNEPSGTTISDASGNGFHLSQSGTITTNFAHLFDSTEKTLYIGTGANSARATTKLGLTPPITGDWTIEACFVGAQSLGSGNALRLFAMGGAGETEAVNVQFDLAVAVGGELRAFWENGAGTNVTTSSGLFLDSSLLYHVAAVKDGTANTVSFYINGRLLSVIDYTAGGEPSGGSGTLIVTIGQDGPTQQTGSMLVGHVAFYNGQKLSETKIFERARAIGLV